MIWVSKEHEIKTKEQWLQLKMMFFFFGGGVELTFGGERIKIRWRGGGD